MATKKTVSRKARGAAAGKPMGRRASSGTPTAQRKPVGKSDGGKRVSVKKPVTRPRASKAADTAARRAVIATALQMSRSGLSPGRSGNVSCRWDDGMLITPTGLPYEDLQPSDIVFVSGTGAASAKGRRPSSEWRFHLGAYRARPDMGAVVHTHSLHATVLACAHKPIPAFHYMVAVAGGTDIPLIAYAPFGTQELADLVGEGLLNRNALLMANHGQIAVGQDLAAALELAQEVEVLAEQFYKVLTLGKPKILGSEAMADVLARFKNYGQNARQK